MASWSTYDISLASVFKEFENESSVIKHTIKQIHVREIQNQNGFCKKISITVNVMISDLMLRNKSTLYTLLFFILIVIVGFLWG